MSCSQRSQTFCFPFLHMHVCLEYHIKVDCLVLLLQCWQTLIHSLYHVVLQLGQAGKQHLLSAAIELDIHWQQAHQLQANSSIELNTRAAMLAIVKVHQI